MEKGQRFLTIRYGTNIVADCIEQHQEVLKRYGECWFGKIGTPPSKRFLDAVMNEDKPRIILYSKEAAYECDVVEISYEKPDTDYPVYYDEYIFNTAIMPRVFFKLSRIDKIEKTEMAPYIVVSSRGRLMDTLQRSMTSFFFSEYPGSGVRKDVPKNSSKHIVKDRRKLEENECVYRHDGKCGCRGFVNYQYECDRPSTCIKQKR